MRIDQERLCDYYAPMNFKRSLLCIFLLLNINACGHFSKTTTTVSTPNIVVSNSETETEPSAKPPANVISTASATTTSKYNNDLLERIRSGFAWPELKSKHTADYTKWNSKHPTYLNGLLNRARPFLFHIVEEIDKRNLPMELALIPAIESAFKPNAVSSSKAAGLWQFIPSTGRYLGLQRNSWLDERRDVIKATNTALDYLTFLNKEVDGDWFLTLAAYNAGIGTVQRAIKKNKKKSRGTRYHNLDLSSETKRYIPKLLALRKIIQNPGKYNLELPNIKNQPYFQVVNLDKTAPIDLTLLAKKMGMEFEELHLLNANFLQANIPTLKEASHILVPISKATRANALIADQKNNPLIEYTRYTIKQGDSLSTIARRHHVSVSAIQSANNLSNSRIRAGRTLLIPYRNNQNNVGNATAQQSKKIHHVKSGDTLWSIARHYQVKIQQLLAWNNISSRQILRLNQPLLIFSNQ